MSKHADGLQKQLDIACQLSNAAWAGWLCLVDNSWQIIHAVRLVKNFRTGLIDFLQSPQVSQWLAGSSQTGRTRSRQTGKMSKVLGCQRIYSFAPPNTKLILVVGADGLCSDHQALFRVLANTQPQGNNAPTEGGSSERTGQARNLRFIHRVLNKIAGATDEAIIAQDTAELLAGYFGYEVAAIFVPDASVENLVALGIAGNKSGSTFLNVTRPILSSTAGRVFRTGEGLFSNGDSTDYKELSTPNRRVRSLVCVPLREANQVFGVINLESSEIISCSDGDKLIIETLAGIVSSTIMNARRNQQLEKKISTLQAVRETALDIVADLDVDALLMRIVHRARELVHAQGAEIGLLDDEQPGIRIQTSENPWYNFSGHLIPIGVGIAGQVLLSGDPVRISDYNQWPKRLKLGVPAEFKAAAGVPLTYKNQVIGTLVVMDDRPDRCFSEEDVHTLEMIAQNISLAIHNAQLYRELQERSEAQRQAEDRLIQSEKMASVGRLTASIAHEINNPLQALQNCLYLAERTDLAEIERQKYLSMARTELDRLIVTVQRMLDFYRPGVRDRQLTDLNQVIRRITDLVEPHLSQKRIQIITNLSPDLPLVMVVPSQIQQVLLNLVLNSMEAMLDGGEITIQTSPCESLIPSKRKSRKQGRPVGAEIYVRDSGSGIPLPHRDGIFEPFMSTKENGLGLGLSVSYGIIQAHGGNLSLVVDGQAGACFRIALPEEK